MAKASEVSVGDHASRVDVERMGCELLVSAECSRVRMMELTSTP